MSGVGDNVDFGKNVFLKHTFFLCYILPVIAKLDFKLWCLARNFPFFQADRNYPCCYSLFTGGCRSSFNSVQLSEKLSTGFLSK
jgi:hypothetical protein